MASTALAKQLATLAGQRKGRGKPSLLFDAVTAEGYDIRTLHSMALNGLAELMSIDTRFSAFATDLFSEGWADLDRETADAERNAEINFRISAFCRLLVGHWSTKGCQKALEYLIRRFSAHVYNVDAMLELGLPHHDSALFGRLFSILDLTTPPASRGSGSNAAPLVAFATDAQKHAAGLPRPLLVAQCLKDVGLLRFICEISNVAIQEESLGRMDASYTLRMYAAIVTSCIMTCPTVTDKLVNVLMPYIVHGLKAAAVPEAQQATYLVLTALSARCPFPRATFDSLVNVAAFAPADKATGALLACIAGMCVTQAGHQAAVFDSSEKEASQEDSLSPQPKSPRLASSSAGTPPQKQWIVSFQFSEKTTTRLLGLPQVDELIRQLSRTADIGVFLRILTVSVFFNISGLIKSVPGGVAAVVSAVAAGAPIATLQPHVRALTRCCVGRARSAMKASPEEKNPDLQAILAAFSSFLRPLAQRFPKEVDEGLLAGLQQPRKRQRTNSLLPPADLEAIAGKPDREVPDTALAAWVSEAILGTLAAPFVSNTAEPASTEAVTLTMALAHASPVVRARGVQLLAETASKLISALGGNDTYVSNAEIARTFQTVVGALHSCLLDEDAAVVRGTLSVLATLVSASVTPALLDSPSLSALVGSSLAVESTPEAIKALARLCHLQLKSLQAMERWIAKASSYERTADIDASAELGVSKIGFDSAVTVLKDFLVFHAEVLAIKFGQVFGALPSKEDQTSAKLRDQFAKNCASTFLSFFPVGNEHADEKFRHPLCAPSVASAITCSAVLESLGLHVFARLPSTVGSAAMSCNSCTAVALSLVDNVLAEPEAAATQLGPLILLADGESPLSTPRGRTVGRVILDGMLQIILQLADANPASSSSDVQAWPLSLLTHSKGSRSSGRKGKATGKAKEQFEYETTIQGALLGLATLNCGLMKQEFLSARDALATATLMKRERTAARVIAPNGEAADGNTVAQRAHQQLASIRGLTFEYVGSAACIPPPAQDSTGKDPYRHMWRAVDQTTPASGVDRQHIWQFLRTHTCFLLSAFCRCAVACAVVARTLPDRSTFALGLLREVVGVPTGFPSVSTSYSEALAAISDPLKTAVVSRVLSRVYLLLCSTPDESITFESLKPAYSPFFDALCPQADSAGVFLCTVAASGRLVGPLVVARTLQLFGALVLEPTVRSSVLPISLPPLLGSLCQEFAAPQGGGIAVKCAALPHGTVRQLCWKTLQQLVSEEPSTQASKALVTAMGIFTSRKEQPQIPDDSSTALALIISDLDSQSPPAVCEFLEMLLLWCGSHGDLTVYGAVCSSILRLVSAVLEHSISHDEHAFDAAAIGALLAAAKPVLQHVVGSVQGGAISWVEYSLLLNLLNLYSLLRRLAFANRGKDQSGTTAVSYITDVLALLKLPSQVRIAPSAVRDRDQYVDPLLPALSSTCGPEVLEFAFAGSHSELSLSFLEALFRLLHQGSADTASAVRHLFGKFPLPSSLLSSYLVYAHILQSPAGTQSSKSKSVQESKSEATLTSFIGQHIAPEGLMHWLTRATAFGEVLLSTLHIQYPGVLGDKAKLERTPFYGCKDLIAQLSRMLDILQAISEMLQSADLKDTLVGGGITEWQDEDVLSSTEYLQRIICDSLLQLASYLAHAPDVTASSAFDPNTVVSVVQSTTSTQTRGVALLLLGRLAALDPERALKLVLPVLKDVGPATMQREDSYSLGILNQLVHVLVPPLLQHGKEAFTVFGLIDTFTSQLAVVPQQRHISIYSACLEASGLQSSPKAVASLLSLIVKQVVVSSGLQPSIVEDLCISLLASVTPSVSIQATGQVLAIAEKLVGAMTDEEFSDDGSSEDDNDLGTDEKAIQLSELVPVLIASEKGVSLSAANVGKFIHSLISLVEKVVGSAQFATVTSELRKEEEAASSLTVEQLQLLQLCNTLLSLMEGIGNQAQSHTPDAQPSVSLSGKKRSLNSAPQSNPAALDAATLAQHRFWMMLLDTCYSVFSVISRTLSPGTFVAACKPIIEHDSLVLRRRFLNFLHSHLSSLSLPHTKDATAQASVYLEQLEHLKETVIRTSGTMLEGSSVKSVDFSALSLHAEQLRVSIDAVSVLADIFAAFAPEKFRSIVQLLTSLTLCAELHKDIPILSKLMKQLPRLADSLFLAVCLTCSKMGAAAVPLVPLVFPALLTWTENCLQLSSTADGVNKRHTLLETLVYCLKLLCTAWPQFVHSYLPRIFAVVFHADVCAGRANKGEMKYHRQVDLQSYIIHDISAAADASHPTVHARRVYFAGLSRNTTQPATERLCPETPAESASHSVSDLKSEHPTVKSISDTTHTGAEIVALILAHVDFRLVCPGLTTTLESSCRAGSVVTPLHHVRAIHALITSTPAKTIRAYVPALFSSLMKALDYRWRAERPSVLEPVLKSPSSQAMIALSTSSSLLECEIAAALISLLLKLSDGQVRPLILQFVQWMNLSEPDLKSELAMAAGVTGSPVTFHPDGATDEVNDVYWQFGQLARKISGFRTVRFLSLALHSMFCSYYALILPDLAKALSSMNAKSEDEASSIFRVLCKLDTAVETSCFHELEKDDLVDDSLVLSSPHSLRCVLLSCLHAFMRSDTEPDPEGYMSSPKLGKQRLEMILRPFVQQFELPLVSHVEHGSSARKPKKSRKGETVIGESESYEALGVPGGRPGFDRFATMYLVSNVGELATALRHDNLWKPLNAALLLVTRDRSARVRLAATKACWRLFERGGEEALVLLPEVLPFLSELLEDADPDVATTSSQLFKFLEDRSEEDLKRYIA